MITFIPPLTPEIAKFKTKWDLRAITNELSNKANQEEQQRFDILLNNLTSAPQIHGSIDLHTSIISSPKEIRKICLSHI